jgi:two-component system CAI-1 autoinducer sensor kinase/phosphatase CqsS
MCSDTQIFLAGHRPKADAVMFMSLPLILRRALDDCRRSFDLAKKDIRVIASLALLIPGAYFIDVFVGDTQFDTLYLRLVIFFLVGSLWFLKPLRPKEETGASIYFVFVATSALPFMFGAMLVLNAALTPPSDEINQLWSLQYVVAMFIFIQVIHGKTLAAALWILSSSLCWLPVLFLNGPNHLELRSTFIQSSACFVTAMIFGLVTNRSADLIENERLLAASAVGSYIAHELRTPLATMRALARSAIRSINELKQKADDKLSLDGSVAKIQETLPKILVELEFSNTLIDMLLLNTKDRFVAPDNLGQHSARGLIIQALDRFPFSSESERKAVAVDLETDFTITADELLITHVFFNLIKNAVFFMQRKAGGRTFVRTGSGRSFNVIEITDTGPGISKETRSRIFERFFTTLGAGQGAGIGLSFCKSVMESIGGQITCESKEGEYTTFRLLFPQPKSGTDAPHSG